MMQEQDRVFFRNYSIVIGILAVMIFIFFVLARVIGMEDSAHAAQRTAEISEATRPVGTAVMTGAEQPAPEAAASSAPSATPAPAVVAQADGAPAAAPAAAPASPAAAAPASSADLGKQVYSGLCFSCHGTGLPGVPQFADKTVWAPRIAKGIDMLHEHALKGFTGESGMMMPPKGGNPALTDEQVKAAVDYIVANGK